MNSTENDFCTWTTFLLRCVWMVYMDGTSWILSNMEKEKIKLNEIVNGNLD